MNVAEVLRNHEAELKLGVILAGPAQSLGCLHRLLKKTAELRRESRFFYIFT